MFRSQRYQCSLFLEAGHGADIVCFEVVSHALQGVDPFLEEDNS